VTKTRVPTQPTDSTQLDLEDGLVEQQDPCSTPSSPWLTGIFETKFVRKKSGSGMGADSYKDAALVVMALTSPTCGTPIKMQNR